MVTETQLTRVEEIALEQYLEYLGVPTISDEDVAAQLEALLPAPTRRTRKWTKAQRAAHSRRMKAIWRARSK